MKWSGSMKILDSVKTNKKRLIPVAVIVLLLLGILGYCLMPDSVDVAQVTKENIQASISEVGYIEADDAVTVYSPVAGKISEVLVSTNDVVKAGEVFAKYDLTSFKEEISIAEANKKYCTDGYTSAVSKNNEYKKMLKTAKTEDEANKQIYAGLLESRDTLLYSQEGKNQNIQHTLNKIEAEHAFLTTQLSIASAQYEAEESAGNKDAAKDARRRISELEGEIKSNRNAMMSMDTGSMTMEEYNVYLEVQRHLDLIDRFWSQNREQMNIAQQAIVPDSQIAQYADSLKLADIQLEKANRNMDIAENGLISAYEGIIIEKLVNTGAYVDVGTPLFVVQPDSGYKAKVMISRYDIGKVALGQKAEISIGGATYEGVVDSISPVAERDSSNKPKVKVFVKLKDTEAKPTIGLETDVKIYMDEEKDILAVSDKAVYVDDDGNYVYVLDNGKVEKKKVVTGDKGNGKTVIQEGLAEGEQVITTPLSDEDVGSRRFAN